MKKTKLLTSFITLPALLSTTISLNSCNKNSGFTISTVGSDPRVIFSGLPEKWTSGDIVCSYQIYDTKMMLDEANSDILAGALSIKTQPGVMYKDGVIRIPASLIIGNITIKIIIKEKGTSYKVSTDSSSPGVTFTGLPKEWTSGDISGNYTFDKERKMLDEANTDILVGGGSVKTQPGVVYTDGTIKIPASLIKGDVTIKIVIKDKAASYKISTEGSSEGVKFAGLPKEWTSGDIEGSYTYDATTKKLDEANTDILVGVKSIKTQPGVEYKGGKIKIPAIEIDGDITIKIITRNIGTYTVSTKGSSEGVTFTGLPTEWTKGQADIEGTYKYDTTTKVLDEDKTDILVGGKSVKTGVEYKDGKIKIPANLITDDVAINIIIKDKGTYYKVSTEGSSKDVTFTGLPTEWKPGDKDIEGEYEYDTETKKLDEENTDILVGGKTIIEEEGVEYKDGTITIPESLITGDVTIKIIIEDKTFYNVSTEGSSKDVIFKDPPEWCEGDVTFSLEYTLDDRSTREVDEENTDILVGGYSIKDQLGVAYKNGTILIPGIYIKGDVELKIVTKDMKGGEGYILTEWPTIISACETFEASDRGGTAETAFLNNFTIIDDKGQEVKPTTLDGLLGAWKYVKINGYNHIVMITDTQHDTIASGQANADKTTALTFELYNLLSDTDGKAMTTVWDTTNNYDYTNSVLRANLNGTGTSSKKTWEKTALELLPTDLQSAIKTVTKKVATTSKYNVTSYTDKLFPLTRTEMTANGHDRAKNEGTTYKYWITHTENENRAKYDVNWDARVGYWFASPDTGQAKNVWCVDGWNSTDGYTSGDTDIGSIVYYSLDESWGVSFAFCI